MQRSHTAEHSAATSPRRARLVVGRALSVAAVLLLLAGAQADTGSKKYVTWVDEDGVVHIADSLPPEAVEQEVKTLNQQGVITEVIPAAPTPEERAERAIEQAERAAIEDQERRAREYRVQLFKSFATVDDLKSYYRSQIRTLYFQQSENDRRVKELRNRLQDLTARARRYNFPYSPDSRRPPIPEDLLADLQDTNAALTDRSARADKIHGQLLDQERRLQEDLAIYMEMSGANGPPPVARSPGGGADGDG